MHRILRFAARGVGVVALALLSAVTAAADIENFRLTDKGLGQFEKATEAMYKFAQDNPEMSRRLDDDENENEEEDGDINAMAKRLDTLAPGLRGKIESSGMTMEDYFTFSIVLATNAFGAALAEQLGGPPDDANLTPVQRANLAFVRKHKERFEQFSAQMQEKYGDVMSGNEDEDEYHEDEYAEDEYYEEEQQ